MRRVVSRPMNVRVVAVGLAAMAHLVVLLLLVVESRMRRHETEPVLLQFVSLWPVADPPPVQPPPVSRAPPVRAAPTAREITPVITPQEPAAPSALVLPQPVAPDAGVMPPIDWSRAAQDAADLYMATHDPPDISSAVIDFSVPRKPCRPPEIGKDLQAKMDELLDRPADPRPPVTSPPGSVMINGQRVGVMMLGGPVGRKSEKIIPPDEILGERRSSVPDPFTCD